MELFCGEALKTHTIFIAKQVIIFQQIPVLINI